MMLFLLKYALGVVIAVLFWQWWQTPHPYFPPVRRGVPIVGILPFIGNNINNAIAQWSVEDNHPVLAVKIGSEYNVYLNTYNAFYEAFVKLDTAIAGKSKVKLFYQVFGNNGLNTRNYSEFFKDQKQLVYKQVEQFVNKNDGMAIKEQGKHLADYLGTQVDKPIDLQKHVFEVAANITSSLVFGKGFSRSDKTYNNLLVTPLRKELGSSASEEKKILLIGLFYDYVSSIPPFRGINEEYKTNQKTLLNTLQLLVEDHKTSFDAKNIRDLTDSILFDKQHGKWKDSPLYSDKHINVLIKGIYTASVVTTKNMVLWNILALMHFPKYQSLIANEIDSVIGSNLPSYKHLEYMPVTNAFLLEVWRYCPAAASTPSHATIKDVALMGYHVPKDTKVVGNIWAAHRDPQVWPNPEKFDPKRHLDKNGKFVFSEKIIPFGLGIRSCAGEAIAKREVAVFFINLLQRFSIKPATDSLPPLNEGVTGAFYSSYSYKVILENR